MGWLDRNTPQRAVQIGRNRKNIRPANKYLLSTCPVPDEGGGAGNTAVDKKKSYRIRGAYILFGRAERKKVRGSAEITGKVVRDGKGKKMRMPRRRN